ncbi:MAG TPA: agmatinase [Candidatus Limousia pullorum]|uniref:Agmatinase n=1 Tax=Candidatus Limousia pullorum TaxID=2840860 RepID=A0A9D1LY84_9FIRM|nr:agmatinase [Anaeromassilibacillus sp. An172]OUP79997.1 agmatinase [Anaeromassilibacillus sp. An172]HIU50205.1 agmatinase [Candidatus Limousia pullorum]
MLNKNIETFMACDAEYEDAKTVLFGAPFDSTTSYRPGTRFGSRTIRQESFGVETYSPYQDKDMTDYSFFDSGDLELCFGSSEKALEDIEERTKTILEDGKRPFMMGGEHLVTLGAVRAVAKKYPDLHIIHFDAHADLREEYLGAQLSHAAVLKRCWELVGDDRIFQFGIRSGDREEFLWGKDHVFTNKFNFNGLKETVESLKGKPIYFTLDLDVLDPSVFPGTGTPEPGGVTFNELRDAVELVCSSLNIVGCDVNELSPPYDPSGISAAAACKIVREMLLALEQ